MAHVTEANTLEDLDHHQLLWKALLAQTQGATFFHSFEWLQTYWRSFGRDQWLRVLIVQSAGASIGILPLTQRTVATRTGAVEALAYPLDEPGRCYGPIGPNPTATLVTAMRYLSAEPNWDLLDLRGVPENSGSARLQLAMRTARLPARQELHCTSTVIDLAGGWNRDGRHGDATLRQRVRHAEHATRGTLLSYERYRPLGSLSGDDDPRWELLDEFLELDDCTRRPASADNAFGSTAYDDRFLRQLHPVAARAGSLDMSLLRCDGQLVAAAYSYLFDGSLQVVRLPIQPQASQLDPGILLLRAMIQDGFERADRDLSLGTATDLHLGWPTRTVALQRCWHSRSRWPRHQLRRWKGWLGSRRQGELSR